MGILVCILKGPRGYLQGVAAKQELFFASDRSEEVQGKHSAHILLYFYDSDLDTCLLDS